MRKNTLSCIVYFLALPKCINFLEKPKQIFNFRIVPLHYRLNEPMLPLVLIYKPHLSLEGVYSPLSVKHGRMEFLAPAIASVS